MRAWMASGLFVVAFGSTASPARAVDAEDIKQAIDRGVTSLRRVQGRDNGQWPHIKIGATALAGLTLLECGVADDDKAVLRAADAVRRSSITLTHTYSICLSILFLDRLGDPEDVPLIESLMVRLLAGQNSTGGWSYECPPISAAETRRLQTNVNERKELVGRRERPRPGDRKRTVKDLPAEIREQLVQIGRREGGGGPGMFGIGDNSNTQFASLTLWVGRRYGLPIEGAVTRLDKHFRTTQMEDGGWSYTGMPRGPDGMAMRGFGMGSTASMTCAGLLGLAIADGATLEFFKEHKPKAKLPDVGKDMNVNKGLQALGAVIENPKNIRLTPFEGQRPEDRVGGRTYYFLWSLERVAVALDLKTIGKKDWYGWGAEILLANQQADGSWRGDYGDSGADTCFALLFLKRANLARDLTTQLQGKMKDPGEREIHAGGIGGDSLRGVKRTVKSGIENKDAKPIRKPLPDAKPADSESTRLARALVKASGDRRTELMEQMRDEKGVQYTEALAVAIPQLEGGAYRKAREALAERLTRLKEKSLIAYLVDEDAEIRRAAALAVAMKESKTLIPHLIPLLGDTEMSVVRATHAALKELTGQDFGPATNASREDRDQAALKWLDWWNKRPK
ncbi:MAG TPA: HEAT repeat domain-containing protein [Gemmataceae bacterium]|nr:HEAT repeat domain-containing protein [Gemmataceae bacterium]